MVKRVMRFILSILMLAVLFIPLGYIDPSKSVLTKIVDLFKVEYFGLVYFAYLVVIFANFVFSLIGVFTESYKCMSISRNTSFISAILLFNYAIMSYESILTVILVILGLITVIFEFVYFLIEKNIAEYQYGGKRKKNVNDIVRLICVLVCFISIGVNKPELGYSAMYYHQNLLKEYGSLANGINFFLCFLFIFAIILSIVSLIKNYFRLRMHASIFSLVLYFVLLFIPFFVQDKVFAIALLIPVGAVIGIINELISIILEKGFDNRES